MKKQLLTLLFIAITTASYAQKKQKDTAKVILPMKDNLVFYEKIIDSLSGQSKSYLFTKSLKWMADSFIDSKEVIQIKDQEAGSIIGSGNCSFVTSGFISVDYTYNFNIEITVKDNKARIRLYQLRNRYLSKYSSTPDLIPIEKGYKEYLAEKVFPRENKKYYLAINTEFEKILEKYTVFIKKTVNDEF